MSNGHHEFLTASEVQYIEEDPFLTVEDVADYRRERDG